MTVRTPRWLQGGSHAAEDDRLLTAALATSAGVNSAAALKVTQQTTPAMSVQVAAGSAFVAGTESALQGLYFVYNDAAVNVTIAAADATNPRRDLIVLRVKDAAYSGAANSATVESVTGTPAASPTLPAVPANCHVLAEIAVAAAATSIIDANITDRREYSSLYQAPRGELAYGALGTGQTFPYSGSEDDITNLSATLTLDADRKILISAEVPYRFGTGATQTLWVRVREGATLLRVATRYQTFISNERERLVVSVRLTPSAGSHTYKVTGEAGIGGGATTWQIENDETATMIVEDIGGLTKPAGSSGQP